VRLSKKLLISNFAVWVVWNMYPETFNGLTACYVARLPFFRNAVASDLLFSAALFGIGYLVSQKASQHASPAALPPGSYRPHWR
jgi:hypothetical protein